jgi:serine protease Do
MKNKIFFLLIILILIGLTIGLSVNNFLNTKDVTAKNYQFDEQEATILAIKKVTPAVVSIIVADSVRLSEIDMATGETKFYTDKQEKGRGTGFIISADGFIITNKHVVNAGSDQAEYKVILNSGKQYYAQLIGKDPLNDLAVLKIFDKNLPYVELGDSDKIEMGTTVIAIGNVLGRYDNSATKGIVSGLSRNLVASNNSGSSEALDNVIQTDAQINPGNSGGPLVDLNGKVIGINVATESSGAAIGFAIPINDAKPVIDSIKKVGRIVRVRLGVRYVMITPQIATENKLKSQTGAWLTSLTSDDPVILSDSPAAKADLQENDIILEVNAIKIDGKITLLSLVQKYKPGDKIGLKIKRGDAVMNKVITLEEAK